jgi:hypothetical protein
MVAPPALLALDICIFVFLLLNEAYIVWRYSQVQTKFSLLILVGTALSSCGQLILTLGLGFEVFDPDLTVRCLIFAYAACSPIYCIAVTQRILIFRESFPRKLSKIINLDNVTYTRSALLFGTIDVLLCWPIFLHVIDPEMGLRNSWINVYHFVGWGLWNCFLLLPDLVLSISTLRKMVKIKGSLNTGAMHSKALQTEQFRYVLLCSFLLVVLLLSDVWNIVQTFVLISQFKHLTRMT